MCRGANGSYRYSGKSSWTQAHLRCLRGSFSLNDLFSTTGTPVFFSNAWIRPQYLGFVVLLTVCCRACSNPGAKYSPAWTACANAHATTSSATRRCLKSTQTVAGVACTRTNNGPDSLHLPYMMWVPQYNSYDAGYFTSLGTAINNYNQTLANADTTDRYQRPARPSHPRAKVRHPPRPAPHRRAAARATRRTGAGHAPRRPRSRHAAPRARRRSSRLGTGRTARRRCEVLRGLILSITRIPPGCRPTRPTTPATMPRSARRSARTMHRSRPDDQQPHRPARRRPTVHEQQRHRHDPPRPLRSDRHPQLRPRGKLFHQAPVVVDRIMSVVYPHF